MVARNYTARKGFRKVFPGTFNFKDEVDGTSGTDIGFVDDATLYNGFCRIIASSTNLPGHNKILQLKDDATPGEDPFIIHNETQATAGTREFWIGTNDVTKEWQISYYETENDWIIILKITASKLQYRDNVDVYQDIQAVVNATPYHIRITWRADNTFDVYVDGVLMVDNVATTNDMVSGIDKLYFQGKGDSEQYLYLDAYGDPDNDADYNIGDNIHWRHYKESTDSFEGDDVGTQGTSITWVDGVDTAASVEIVQEFNEHKKILRQDYTSGAGGNDSSIHNFATAAKDGWFSCWIKVSDVSGTSWIELKDVETTSITVFAIRNGQFQKYTGGAWSQVDGSPTPVNDTWYLIYLKWTDAATDTIDCWIDNIFYETYNAKNNQEFPISSIYVTSTILNDYIYLDAPMSSLDSDSRGDNRTFDYHLYSYTDITEDLYGVEVLKKPYEIHYTSNDKKLYLVGDKALIKTNTSFELEDDKHFVMLFNNSGSLIFEGDVLKENEKSGAFLIWKLKSVNRIELEERITHNWTADPSTVFEMLQDLLTNVGQEDGRLILDPGSDNPAGTFTFGVEEYPLCELLEQIADLQSRVIEIKPNGVCKLTTGTSLGVTITKDSGHVASHPDTVVNTETKNWVKVYGGWDSDTGTPFTGISQDAADIAERGYRKYWDVYDNILSDSECESKAAALRANLASLKWVNVKLKGLDFTTVFTTLTFSFSVYTLIASPESYSILECKYDLFTDIGMFRICTGVVQPSKYNREPYNSYEQSVNDIRKRIYETDLNTIDLQMRPYVASWLNDYIIVDANEGICCNFLAGAKIDASRNIIITIVYTANGNVTNCSWFIESRATDDSEGTGIWNVEPGTAEIIPAGTNGKENRLVYILSSEDYEINDLVRIWFLIDNGEPSLIFFNITVQYYVKRYIS